MKDLRKIVSITFMCFTVLFCCGCQGRADSFAGMETESSEVEIVPEETAELSSAEMTEEGSAEAQEAEQAEEVQNVPVTVEFGGFNQIDEEEALDLVYNYLYGDEASRTGSGKGRELVCEGLSPNEFFYIFSEWDVRTDGDGNPFREISDHIAISVDGKMIIKQRERDQWLAYDKLTGESTLISSDGITCYTYAFCITKFELSDGVLTVVGNDGSANGWKVEPVSISYPLSSDCEWAIGYFGYSNGTDNYYVKLRDTGYEEIKGWTEHDYTGEEISSPSGINFYISDGYIDKVLVHEP